MTDVLAPGRGKTLTFTPQRPGRTFYTTSVKTTESGTTFEFVSIQVGTSGQNDGGFPASTFAAGKRHNLFDGCPFPQAISFTVRNVGEAPGRLLIEIGGDYEEPLLGPAEVFTIS